MEHYLYLILGNVVLGVLGRIMVVSILTSAIKFNIKDKKKKSKVSLEIKNERSRVFIGYLGMASTVYFAVSDFNYGFDENFNSLIWLGMFAPEITLSLKKLFSKTEKENVKQNG